MVPVFQLSLFSFFVYLVLLLKLNVIVQHGSVHLFRVILAESSNFF